MGSMRYVSHWTHEGNELSRRDDIEMLIYSIMKLLGDEPRQELWKVQMREGMSQTEMDVQFYNQKMNFMNSDFVPPRLKTIRDMLLFCKDLGFE